MSAVTIVCAAVASPPEAVRVVSPQNIGLHVRPKLEEAIASRHGEVVGKIFEQEGMLDVLAELMQRSVYREAQQTQ